MPTEERMDAPFQGSIFELTITDKNMGMFTGCSGLGFECDLITHKTVNSQGIQLEQKIPGVWKYNEVVFKRGVTANQDLYTWYEAFAAGNHEYKTAAVTVIDRDNTRLATFNLDRCWPSKLTVSDLSVDSDEVMIEELTIQVHEIEWMDS